MRNRLLLLKNAAANLARGGAIAAFSLLLPPFLVRHMDTTRYGIWVLVLQTTAYISFLDFGLQTAVGRYIAHAEEREDHPQRDAIYSTALLGLLITGAVSFLLLLVLAAAIPWLFSAVPRASIPTMRWMMLIIGSSIAVGLPSNAINGVFIGLQRHEIPAATTGGARLLSAVGIVLTVLARLSLVAMAVPVAAANLLSYGVQYVALRRAAPQIRFRLQAVQGWAARELLRYCFALTVMSFSMLLVNGFDLILVGRFDFAAVVPYSVVSSFIPVIAGCLYAVLNALMPQAARMHAQGDAAALGSLVIASTQASVLLLIFTGLPAVIYAGPLLHLWVGRAFTHQGQMILIVLILANVVRLMGAAYATVLVAAGQQRLIKISPLTEGFSNLLASVLLGATLGAIGVAYGTMVGAVVGMIAHLVYSMPRTHAEIRFSRGHYLWSGIALPLLCSSPLLAMAAASISGRPVSWQLFVPLLALSLAFSLWLLERSGVIGGNLRRLRPSWL